VGDAPWTRDDASCRATDGARVRTKPVHATIDARGDDSVMLVAGSGMIV
jgi:hypothetical protein